MPRRVSVPQPDDLFRPTVVPDPSGEPSETDAEALDRVPPQPAEPAEVAGGEKSPSGRVRHDEKMTVYVTSEELLDLESARLNLRRHGIAVDRGRLVREALSLVLSDFETQGRHSALVRRLSAE